MPQALGDFPVNGKVSFLWNTNGQDGASITRSTDGTLKIFKSHATAATWATERSSLAGVTQLEDFDATGIHSVYIDLSDNTDAGFYAAGNEYQVAIVGAVVDTKTVNAVLASFSIERNVGLSTQAKLDVNAEADTALADYDAPTKAEQDAAFTEIKGATWAAGTDTLELIRDKETDIDTKTTNLPTDPADESLIIAATDAIMTRLGVPAASVSADVAAVKVDTAAIKTNTDNLPSAVKKNTARRLHFYMVLASDHVTPATGLTVAATRALDGALLFTASAGAVTEVASGWYFIDAAAGDLNGDTVAWKMTAATADPCCFSILTEP